MGVTVELSGLEVFGHHGATEEEREAGRTLLYDVSWQLGDDALSDRLEDTVDYDRVAACVREVSDGRRFHLLEALASAVADSIVARFPVESVCVRVRKVGIRPAGLALAHSAACVERSR
ncbi:MAG: dihydroneopterin aldolase [Actinomycetota bacterium]|nr:dihydroneopterin aldolase [Actinomycetota bacterium]